MLEGGSRISGLLGLNNFAVLDNDLTQGFYRKLEEGSEMSIDSIGSLQTSTDGGSVAMSTESVGSNNGSRTRILNHESLKRRATDSLSVAYSINRRGRVRHHMSGDALASALMDESSPSLGLEHLEHCRLDLDKLVVGEAFAEGAFGKIYRGTYKGADVAIKILEKPDNDTEKAKLLDQQFQQEVNMLSNLKHPNIVRFIGACKKAKLLCIVTEYAQGGSLRHFLMKRQNKSVPLKLAVQQALDVARGMRYIHSCGMIHRDLKSDNLLIFDDKSIKIADFGVARIEVTNEGMTPETGTYRWMAPEMLQHRPYTQKVDVYSFGIVLWELVTGMLPFYNMTAVQAAFGVVNKGIRPPIPPDCLPALKSIMIRCWERSSRFRPPFDEVVTKLERIETEILTTVRKARFRCCINKPMTME